MFQYRKNFTLKIFDPLTLMLSLLSQSQNFGLFG